jgi:hypothetical protein
MYKTQLYVHNPVPFFKRLCAKIQFKSKSSAGGMDQAVECLPSKCEVLSSNTSTAKKQTKILREKGK